MSADVENQAPPTGPVLPVSKLDREFAAIILAGLPVDFPGKKYDEAAAWTARMVCEVRELANGAHRMKRRDATSRYWDCVKCGQFLCDIMSRPRSRISVRIAERSLGRCPGKPPAPATPTVKP